MRGFLFALFAALFFIGCSSKTVLDPYADTSAAKSYETIMKITLNCEPCADTNYETTINGYTYRSDVAINCCTNLRKIDAGAGLKKVYLHNIADLRENSKVIKANGKAYSLNKRLDTLFYLAMKEELTNRGMLVVDSQTSPYTLRVDFGFTDFKGVYSPGASQLNSRLQGILRIKNINYDKRIQINTRQSVSGLSANDVSDFGLYMDLLVKQAVNKAAEQISKF
ncbi:hypothetical protein [Campylobacter fetus]|uniref:Membrane protein n=1 Tax=Campylobacter fetus subsp. testudinum TaxID=1507806 RepID=A0AAX0HD77_CAMFE|nr:hypothetical protein [Campylobacter fetus]AGZ82277.1 outer membrane liproprotein [Campylobacter fetus subsp. testudinum 03-427]AJB46002.1 membrane protein [Campylobacter fetus subsp. testudinum]AVK81691.1 hypothetical protein C6B32_07670 [Campylobacter fetus subsp. testudinum]EAI4322085.1 hypothetical protein [Campylobacter fetus]EAI4391719.1 hypothetical protein [Campylobacter fetus]